MLVGPRKRGGPRDARTSGGLDESPKEAPAVTDDTRSVNPHPLSSRGLFVPLDVNYADDPKMIEAGAEAELVYVRSLAIAKRIGSDGAIHRAHLPRLCDGIFAVVMGEDTPEDLAARLVKVGAWIEAPDGWVIASWDKWNLTAEEIQSRRSGRQKGAAIGNHRRWHEARGEFDPACVYCTESLSGQSSDSLGIGIATESESTKTETYARDFASWYADYPRKVGRQAAEKAYRARRRAGLTAEDLLRARENYAVSVATVESQFIKHPSTFLGPDVVEWIAAAPHAPTTVKPSTYGTPTRALLGRGVDAAPTWELDDEGRAVPAAEVG